MAGGTKTYIIAGKVQRVGYRNFVATAARGLHLSGWVRNLPDGGVEAYVTGPAARLKKLEAELRIGPPRAEVRMVEGSEVPPGVKIEGFHIR